MALEQKTYTLTAGADNTETLKRFGGWDTYSIDVISATGTFELIFQASADGTEWDDLFNSGTVSDIDAKLINVAPTYIQTRIKVTDISGAGNVIVVDVTPFADSESLLMTNEVGGLINHTKQFTGTVWYVDASVSASGDGSTPDNAFKTIGEAITATSEGDAITVKAGTYTETGLDLDENATEIWFEIGAVIDPASGTALTVSGDYCRVSGNHKITPAAGEIGLLISGAECFISDGKVLNGETGVCITGSGAIVHDYAVGFPTVMAYDIRGMQGRLRDCSTVGNAATIGYAINAGADTGVLDSCTSAGHETAGYSIAAGSQDWTILNCSSGAGDGRWVDADHANVWSNFSFDDVLNKSLTLDGSASQNLFQVTGTVEILYIYGTVETALAADVTGAVLEFYDSAAAVDITKTAGAPDISSLPTGSYLAKISAATAILNATTSANGAIVENIGNIFSLFTLIQKTASADCFIRLTRAGAGASGVIDWHIEWRPLSDDGFVEVV